MPKYIIDGNINFYDELYKSLDEKTDKEEEEEEYENKCLITNCVLTDTHVKLTCGHKFNYDALFHDISMHKKKHNFMEKDILRQNEIRCPYCRNVQKTLLPELEGYDKVNGVNCFVIEPSVYAIGICSHVENNFICGKKYGKILVADNKFYCLHHHTTVQKKINVAKYMEMKQMLKESQEKKKQQVKEEKEKAKQQVKEEKEKEKEKEKAKENNKNSEKKKNKKSLSSIIPNENTIVQQVQHVQIDKCKHIMQNGINKGTLCGKKLCNNTAYCKTHCNKYCNMNIEQITEIMEIVE